MYKTVHVELSERHGLDIPGLYAKVIPISWLPSRVTKDFLVMYREIDKVRSKVEDNPESSEAIDAGQMMIDLATAILPDIVKEWNLPDFEGKIMPLPREMAKQSKEALAEIPQTIIMDLFEAAMEDTGDVPPMSARESSNTPSPALTNQDLASPVLQPSEPILSVVPQTHDQTAEWQPAPIS